MIFVGMQAVKICLPRAVGAAMVRNTRNSLVLYILGCQTLLVIFYFDLMPVIKYLLTLLLLKAAIACEKSFGEFLKVSGFVRNASLLRKLTIRGKVKQVELYYFSR